MQPKIKVHSYRTFNPFDNRSPGGNAVLSPLTDKSIMPFNNVPTIQDLLSGNIKIEDYYPHAGGSWSPGQDTEKNYREKGDDYKRQVLDEEIITKMLQKDPTVVQEWEVLVPGGSHRRMSFDLAVKYIRENGLPFSRIRRVPNSQLLSPTAQTNSLDDEKNRIEIISDGLTKTLMVESIDFTKGIMETGSAFCIYPNYFITCAHVLKHYNKNKETGEDFYYDSEYFKSNSISLIQNGQKHEARVVNANSKLDIALLSCDIDIEPLVLDKSVEIGNDIIAIGSPHGYENNVSTGNIGSLNRKVYFYSGAPVYTFVDLAIFPGNSGGPVIKLNNGKVVSMITLIVSAEGGYGLNASLPSSYIEDFCAKNIKDFLDIAKEI